MHIKYLNERETLDIKCTLQSIDDWPHRAEKQGRNQELPTVPRTKTLYLSGQRIHSLIKKNKTKRRLSKPFHIYIVGAMLLYWLTNSIINLYLPNVTRVT